MKGIPMYVGDKVVGQVVGNALYKSVKGSIHFLRNPPSICNDVALLNAAEKAGATYVIIKDKETGKRYIATIADIRKLGKSLNRGANSQIRLVMGYWREMPL
jgi:hypothetical protein